MPVNLFPLTWLLPSGNLFIQAERQAEIFDYKNMIEYDIANIPDSVRVYPASAGTALFPMTPANNWTATIIFCGGTNLNADQWLTNWNISAYAADTSCVTITPDVDLTWYHDDALAAGRSMGNVRFVLLAWCLYSVHQPTRWTTILCQRSRNRYSWIRQ